MEAAAPASARAYTRLVLKIYDLWVLKISNRFFWNCPTKRQLEHFQRFQSLNHLDVGVGTGYYLNRSKITKSAVRLGLMDINRNSLDSAEKVLSRFSPEIFIHDILRPIRQDIAPFDSISLNYVIHCLEGPMMKKEPAIKNLKSILQPFGILFGATILGQQKPFNFPGRVILELYNRKGVFGNEYDSLNSLRSMLSNHFKYVETKVIGNVALFAASDEPILS
ncbi:class I SAM-dependent methyltransferase [Pseudobacteriovorax antillogorgiicola]|uniref:Methyltransferase domain-containing protein n=1 Tax=Pseudobacteriovorax antillogorgiicola TaxID=1513793 RepID=A0A1Y6C805_9BACT|nr:class I SAM-dependent methyltransferase [Pseudobacteriovorax antillogorgiicola]TCS51753.1 hypothetical protein EDD56_110138 [Pseudobacteriovorax antillogorgiicola]SMF49723.1 hypothetical protein SAMN06296036_115107 [Pseudobacteriovorax antillogorgiicola]